MAVTSSHSAAGNALGYVYQCQWALVELAERGIDDPNVELRMEVLDDVDFSQDGTPTELLQVKHHLNPAQDLTEKSTDLWRTINSWIDSVSFEPDSPFPLLRLVTTAIVPDTSALAMLRADQRDPHAAVQALEAVAVASKAKITDPWRRKFIDLSPVEKMTLVSSIVISDGASHARNLDDRLKRSFGYILPRGHELEFIEYIKGWWNGISVQLLSGALPAISAEDLRVRAEDLRDQFSPDNLPMSPTVMQPFTGEDADAYRDRRFVAQLTWIALDENRLLKAIRDYHRAYTQRSEWLRNNLVSETEIDRFAFTLHDEWEQVFDRIVARTTEDSKDSIGRRIFEDVCAESHARIRDRFDQGWLNRGTFHQLAEGMSGYTIGWHPDFVSKLAALLSPVSEGE